jgi:hypothetical protein
MGWNRIVDITERYCPINEDKIVLLTATISRSNLLQKYNAQELLQKNRDSPLTVSVVMESTALLNLVHTTQQKRIADCPDGNDSQGLPAHPLLPSSTIQSLECGV